MVCVVLIELHVYNACESTFYHIEREHIMLITTCIHCSICCSGSVCLCIPYSIILDGALSIKSLGVWEGRKGRGRGERILYTCFFSQYIFSVWCVFNYITDSPLSSVILARCGHTCTSYIYHRIGGG